MIAKTIAIGLLLHGGGFAVAGPLGIAPHGYDMTAIALALIAPGLVIAVIEMAVPFRKPLSHWPTRRVEVAKQTALGRMLLHRSSSTGIIWWNGRYTAVALWALGVPALGVIAGKTAVIAVLGEDGYDLVVDALIGLVLTASALHIRSGQIDMSNGFWTWRSWTGVFGWGMVGLAAWAVALTFRTSIDLDYEALDAFGAAIKAAFALLLAWLFWPFAEDLLQRIRCLEYLRLGHPRAR